MMRTYMVIERFKEARIVELYDRFDRQGRMLPDGVHYINSWIDEDVMTCFQVMQSESRELLDLWTSRWDDLADFEVIPVIDSTTAREKILGT